MPITSITFDLWDTVLHDDTDEAKRAAAGLRSKPDERRFLLWQALSETAPIERAASDLAFDVHEAAFRKVWYGQSVTWEVADRLEVILKGLGRTLAPETLAGVIGAYEDMEPELPPDLVPGATEAIAELAGRYRLCVISDTIYTPGRGLRRILDHYGLSEHFAGFVFSDECGHSKPHPSTFASASEQLGVPYSEMLHIGDREPKDVQGPKALGMGAILFTAVRDEGAADTTIADAVCDGYATLPGIVDRLAAA